MKFLSFDCAFSSIACLYVEVNADHRKNISPILRDLDKLIKLGENPFKNIENKSVKYDYTQSDYKLALEHAINFNKSGFVNILYNYCGSILKKDEKVTELNKHEKILRLKDFLTKLEKTIDIAPDTIILIEYQPNQIGGKFGAKLNLDTILMENILHYHFIGRFHVELMNAKLKNKISFAPHLEYDEIEKKIIAKTTTKTNAKTTAKNGGTISEPKTDIQTAAKKAKNKYAARKLHTSENFKYMASLFNIDISGIPNMYFDDAADAFIQIFVYISENDLLK